MKRILFLAIFTLIISSACSSSPDVMDTAIDKQKELDAAYEKATSEMANDAKAKAKEERLAQEEEDRKIHDEEEIKSNEDRLAQEEEDRLAQVEETGDPRKDEIDMFKRIVSENTGPACNIYGIAHVQNGKIL